MAWNYKLHIVCLLLIPAATENNMKLSGLKLTWKTWSKFYNASSVTRIKWLGCNQVTSQSISFLKKNLFLINQREENDNIHCIQIYSEACKYILSEKSLIQNCPTAENDKFRLHCIQCYSEAWKHILPEKPLIHTCPIE